MLLRIAQHANHDEDSYFLEMRQHKGEHNVARNNDNEDNFVNNNNIIYIIANSNPLKKTAKMKNNPRSHVGSDLVRQDRQMKANSFNPRSHVGSDPPL